MNSEQLWLPAHLHKIKPVKNPIVDGSGGATEVPALAVDESFSSWWLLGEGESLFIFIIFLWFFGHFTHNHNYCCKCNFYLPDVSVILEICCWINPPFPALSELWLAGSTQLFWLKAWLTSISLLSTSHSTALLGLGLTLSVCSNPLAPYVFTCNLSL